jgi:endo-1,4-beta-xylanase
LKDSSDASLQAEADIYKDLLDVCLSESACTLFQTWGFTDRYSWIPIAYPGYGWALPFDLRYRKKPAYDALLKELQSRDKIESRLGFAVSNDVAPKRANGRKTINPSVTE